MSEEQRSRAGAGQWIAWVCWGIIGSFLALKIARLLQGSPILAELDFADTSLLGIAAGISALVLSSRAGSVGAGAFLALLGLTILLAVGMLGVGFLVSVVCRRSGVATGVALFIWLALVFLTDLALMTSSILLELRVQEVFGIAIANPLQAFKMAVVLSMNASLDVLGPVGAILAIPATLLVRALLLDADPDAFCARSLSGDPADPPRSAAPDRPAEPEQLTTPPPPSEGAQLDPARPIDDTPPGPS